MTLLRGLGVLCAVLTAMEGRAQPAAAKAEDVSAQLAPVIQRHNLPGMVAAVVEGDRVVATGAAGVRVQGGRDAVTLADRFHLGSCTKTMTATLCAMLVEEEKLRIDTRFNRELAQHARAKAVNRRDHRAVERAFVVEPPSSLFFVGDAQHLVQLAAQALVHFVCSAIGEGDRDDLIDRETVFAEDVDVALDEHGGLARPRPRRH